MLAIVKHRDARALASFFVEQGRKWCRGVEVVVTDGSESYTAAIGWHLPRATHILDRFHVVRWFARGLIEVRRHLQRREPPGVTPVFDPEVFRARFLALKRADRLDDAERARLEAIFAARAELARAWSMLQELYGLYAAEDLAAAEEHLDRFARMWEADPLPEFYRVASDIIRWAPEIFNFHRRRPLVQRTARGHQQPPRPVEAHGVRVRQRRQLRSPRHPPHPRPRPMKSRSLEELPPLMSDFASVQDDLGTVHFSRFMVEGDEKLLFLSDIDGEIDQHIERLVESAGPVLDAIFRHVDDPPGTPVAGNPEKVSKWLKHHAHKPLDTLLRLRGRLG